MFRALTMTLALSTIVGGCASTQTADPSGVHDPFEPLNRQVFAFNEVADHAVIGPVASGYKAVTPGFARTGIRNFLANLNSPVIFINDVLQGEPKRAEETLARFVINSTVGIGGLFDVAASNDGIERHSEDFGQTLGVWGFDEGPFLVLPLLGPSNLRDGIGFGVDTALDPLTWTEFDGAEDADDMLATSRTVLGALEARIAVDDALATLREQPEPYIAMRRTYTAQREAAIRNGQEAADPYTDLPDFGDFE